MDIKLHPQHILLGITPDSPAQGRKKVITAFIGIAITASVMLAQDIKLIKYRTRTLISQVTAKRKPCPRFNSLFE